ncbi:MAG: hypothetical protein FI703_06620 [SAR202 cluster bacterium]|nr:hypothetical protein [SAR202 cluster bacterium]
MAIEDYIQPGERIVAECAGVYATNHRIIHYTPRSKSLTFREYAYPQITALKLVPKARFSTVFLGFIVTLLSLLAGPGSPFQVGVAALGVGAMGMGLLLGDRYLEVTGDADDGKPAQWRLRDASGKESKEFLAAARAAMAGPPALVAVTPAIVIETSMSGTVPRSVLLIPADQPAQVRSALESVADVVCIDMADLVHPANRAAARLMMWGEVTAAARSSKGVWAQIGVESLQEDLEACVWPGLGAVVAHVDSAEAVRGLDDALAAWEKERDVQSQVSIVVALDTAAAVWSVRETLVASPRVLAAAVGGQDLLHLPETISPRQLFSAQEYMQGRIAAGAIEAGVPMLGKIGTDIALGHLAEALGTIVDTRIFRAAQTARGDGFHGAVTTHLEALSACNTAFPLSVPMLTPLQPPAPLAAHLQPVVPSHFELAQIAPQTTPTPSAYNPVVPSHFDVKPQTMPPVPERSRPVAAPRGLKSLPLSPSNWRPVVPSHFGRVVPPPEAG